MTSLAPLGKGDRSGAKFIEVRDELSGAVAVDEVPIKPLKALLDCHPMGQQSPSSLGEVSRSDGGGILPIFHTYFC